MKFNLVILALSLAIAAQLARAEPELALQKDVQVEVKDSSGSLFILTSEGFDRKYKVGACTLSAHMTPRRYRWYGSLGIYDPATSHYSQSPQASTSPSCNGLTRTVVAEGQIHFGSVEAASSWLERYSKVSRTVWSPDGLVVRWAISPNREQLNVDVWQVCVSGAWPQSLPGGSKDFLVVSGPSDGGAPRRACTVVATAVIEETEKAWQQHWKEADEWATRN